MGKEREPRNVIVNYAAASGCFNRRCADGRAYSELDERIEEDRKRLRKIGEGVRVEKSVG
jgi:hypothetical protein